MTHESSSGVRVALATNGEQSTTTADAAPVLPLFVASLLPANAAAAAAPVSAAAAAAAAAQAAMAASPVPIMVSGGRPVFASDEVLPHLFPDSGELLCHHWIGDHHPVRPCKLLTDLVGVTVHFRFVFRQRLVGLVEKYIDGEFEYAFEYDYYELSRNLKRVVTTRALLGVIIEHFDDRIFDDATLPQQIQQHEGDYEEDI